MNCAKERQIVGSAAPRWHQWYQLWEEYRWATTRCKSLVPRPQVLPHKHQTINCMRGRICGKSYLWPQCNCGAASVDRLARLSPRVWLRKLASFSIAWVIICVFLTLPFHTAHTVSIVYIASSSFIVRSRKWLDHCILFLSTTVWLWCYSEKTQNWTVSRPWQLKVINSAVVINFIGNWFENGVVVTGRLDRKVWGGKIKNVIMRSSLSLSVQWADTLIAEQNDDTGTEVEVHGVTTEKRKH